MNFRHKFLKPNFPKKFHNKFSRHFSQQDPQRKFPKYFSLTRFTIKISPMNFRKIFLQKFTNKFPQQISATNYFHNKFLNPNFPKKFHNKFPHHLSQQYPQRKLPQYFSQTRFTIKFPQ